MLSSKMTLRLANKEAHKSTFRQRLGAVIVKGGRVLAVGHNSIRYANTHLPKKHPQSLHAEQAAMLRAMRNGHNLAGSTMFVVRVNKHDRPCLAKPCSVCLEWIKVLGVKKVYFTTNEGIECIPKL